MKDQGIKIVLMMLLLSPPSSLFPPTVLLFNYPPTLFNRNLYVKQCGEVAGGGMMNCIKAGIQHAHH